MTIGTRVSSLICYTTTGCNGEYAEYYLYYHKKLKFSGQRSKKTRDSQKKKYYSNFEFQNLAKIALVPKLLGF